MCVGINLVCNTMPKKNIAPDELSTNSTAHHKVHVRLYECGPGVCYLQQLPLGLCLPLYSVLSAKCSIMCACISVRSYIWVGEPYSM